MLWMDDRLMHEGCMEGGWIHGRWIGGCRAKRRKRMRAKDLSVRQRVMGLGTVV